MAESRDWNFPDKMRPRAEHAHFDLETAYDAVVALRAEVPDTAFTAPMLGTDRGGNGVVIGEGLVLTIGYLITEATNVWLTTRAGVVVAGYPLAYDQPSGFGLVRALGPLPAPALPRGRAAAVALEDTVFVISHGGARHALQARLTDRREFAGSWEYLVEHALYTTPAHPEWSGAAALDDRGRLIGIGSLLTQEKVGERTVQHNMVVPIDLLEPILDSLLSTGRSGLPARPWLGLYAGEAEGGVVVGGVSERGPAARAGVREGDLVIDVGGVRVTSLGGFLRAVWQRGAAGVTVPLTLGREGDLVRVEVRSVDRNDLLARPPMH
jgi:S1-C subfamily serine protease